MTTPTTYRKIYRSSAWYDLSVTWPFATPLTFELFRTTMNGFHAHFGIGEVPPLTLHGMLFTNFFGVIVILWSVVRLQLDMPILGRYDAASRFAFAALMGATVLVGGSPFLWGYMAVELAFGVLQLLPVHHAQAQR